MAFQLLRYAVAAMQRHIEQCNNQLPVVIPLLFYHGTTSPYPYSNPMAGLLFRARIGGHDLSSGVSAGRYHRNTGYRRVALLELVQKHIRTRDMLELVNELAELLEQWAYPKEQFRSLLYYLARMGFHFV